MELKKSCSSDKKRGEWVRNVLKGLRLTANLTQQDVANSLNIGRTSYTNIELGNKNPSLDLAISIKKLFKYEKDDIFLNQ